MPPPRSVVLLVAGRVADADLTRYEYDKWNVFRIRSKSNCLYSVVVGLLEVRDQGAMAIERLLNMFRISFLAHLVIDQAAAVELARADDTGALRFLNTL